MFRLSWCSVLICAVTLLLIPATARAAIILEAELDGTAVNNNIGSAQLIPGAAFTQPVPSTVFDPPGYPTATVLGAGGDNDVDFFAFAATGPKVYFDIDNDPSTFDTILSLFDSTGTLLAYGDDSFPADPGSALETDSFLGVYDLPGPGTYFIAVSQFDNYATATFTATSVTSLVRPDGVIDPSNNLAVEGVTIGDASFVRDGAQIGPDYTLHISLQEGPFAVVPEPASVVIWTLGGAGFGAVGYWRKRRKNRKA